MSEGPPRRIQTIRDGRLEPLIPRPPLLSSGDNWQGITLEKHLADADYDRSDFEVYSNLVHVFTGAPAQQEWRTKGRNFRVQNVAGSIMIVPRGLHASVHVSRSRPDVQWILELDRAVIERRAQEATGARVLELAPQFDLRDPQVLRLVQSLQADAEGGLPAGSLFGELIGDALAVYLTERYSANLPNITPTAGGLPVSRLKRVLEYIQANLDRDIHLDELAAASSLSTFHFAKLFKQSTGSTPHQYVLQRRLERVKELLRDPNISISDVSLQAGFSDQSHLTNVFRRFVGITPSRFRSLLF
jgi:AraC family transcriptional regulator